MAWWKQWKKNSYDRGLVDRCLRQPKQQLGQSLDVVLAELLKAEPIAWTAWEQLRDLGFARAAVLWLQASPAEEALKAGEILSELSRRAEWRTQFPAPPRPAIPAPTAATPLGSPQLLGLPQPERLYPRAQRLGFSSPGFIGSRMLARVQEDYYEDAPQGGSYVTSEASIQCWDCRTLEHLWTWPHDGLLAAGTSQASYWAHTRREGIAILGPDGFQDHLDFPIWSNFFYATPDGRTVVAGSETQVYRFEVANRRLALRRRLAAGVVNAHRMSPYFSADEDELLISFEETQHPVHRFRLDDLRHTPLRSSWRELEAFRHNQPAEQQRTLSPDGLWQAGLVEGDLQLWSCKP